MRSVVLVAPLVLLGTWGFSYLRDCISTVSAPGVPIQLLVHTPEGIVRLEAESYAAVISRGVIKVTRPRLYDPSGKLLASANQVMFSGLDIKRGSDQTVHVTVSDLYGRLTRFKNGKFQLEYLIPARTGKPSQIPYSVEVRNAQIDLVDEAGPRPYFLKATSSEMRVAGISDDFTASGTLEVAGVGTASAALHRTAASGLRLDVSTQRMELASLIRHIKEIPEGSQLAAAGIDADSALLTGPASVIIPPRGSVSIRSKSKVVLSHAAFRGQYADQVTFQGSASQNGAEGHLEARAGSATGTFDGSVRWLGKLTGGGQFALHADRRESLPAFATKLLPKGLLFSGMDSQGWLTLVGPNQYSAQGTLRASSVSANGQEVTAIDTQFSSNQTNAIVSLTSAKWNGQIVTGGIDVSLPSRAIEGGFHASMVDLKTIAEMVHHPEVSGSATGDLVLRGSVDHPQIAFRTLGTATYKTKGIHFKPFQFEASGAYANGKIQIDRADLDGTEGETFMSGVVRSDHSIDLHVAGRQLQLGSIFDRISGQVNVEAKITGTLSTPLAKGRAEAYAVQLRGHEIPLITADFVADNKSASITDARAIEGAAQADGQGRIFFATRHLSAQGRVTGVQLADYLGENYVGTVDAPSVSVVGSITAPLVSADVVGESLVLKGVKIDHVELHASADRNGATLDSATAELAGGKATATGDYDFGTKVAHLQAEAEPLDLRQLLDSFSTDVSTTGTVAGTANIELEGNKIRVGTAKGRVKGLAINGTLIGDGPWNVSGSDTKIKGSIEVGQLSRFIALNDLVLDYGPDKPVVSGTADLYNLPVSDIVNAGIKYFPNLSYDAFNTVQSASGSVNAALQFEGDILDPAIAVSSFEASDLSVQGEKLGTLEAQFGRKDHTWDIGSFRLSGGPGTLTFSGTVAEQGKIHLDGDLSNLQLAQMAGLEPRLANMSGQVNSSFTVEGETAHPEVRASLTASGLFEDPTVKNEDRSLRVELAPITMTETRVLPDGSTTGGIDISGSYFYRGFVGKLSAQAPLKYPLEIPDDQAIKASLSVDKRSLKDISEIVGGLDVKRTNGTVGGSIAVTGTTKQVVLTGNLDLIASTFATEGMDDLLQDFSVNVALKNNTAVLTASGKSSLGGSVKATISSQLNDLSASVSKFSSQGSGSLLNQPLDGTITFDRLRVRQSFPQKTYVQGILSGDIALSGTFKRPSISGSASVSSLDSVVPTLTSNPLNQVPLTIDPKFDLNVTLADTAHINASSAELYLNGGGSVKGSLAEPQIDANLSVQKGQLRLPASVVRLEEGGTVALTYHANRGETIARLDVDLTGLTQVVAPGTGDTIQRYDITLGVRGNLLADNGLTLTADSDPPDLTQDRILGLLGQTDALQAINPGSGVSRGAAQQQIQSAMAGFALPSLANSVTASIAKSLGLDYLDLGFNAYQDANFSFAKTLGSDLTFQGSRGISQPPPGYPFQYDYRLVLHPRRFSGILQRFSLFLGTDQDHPYKFGLIYGTRF